MRASKALGRRHDSDEEAASDPEVASESGDEGAGGPDPFFQHDADVFNDPFFTAVRPASRAKDRGPRPCPTARGQRGCGLLLQRRPPCRARVLEP